ncbi:hypothetical protein ACMFMG_006912 [Clarireedia jacksonii]
MHRSILLFVSTLLPAIISAQQLEDGAIVPFRSSLPSCASQCGPLSDVQGKCVLGASSSYNSCFCSDSRLTPFLQGTSGVSSVCGAASCTSSTDLQTIESWYEGYCNEKTAATTTTSSSGSSTATSSSNSSSSSSSGSPPTWFSTHWKWVVMLIVLVVGITGSWLTAAFFRRRYLRKREREIEMRPPVALGPHQVQGMTAGYKYGDGIVNNANGGHHKDAARSTVTATPADATRGKRESNLQKKSRR